MSISAVVITKNEEKNIVDCIESLSFCDEIIVIDDNSTDETFLIAKKLKAKVFVRSLDGDFSNQRNFGLDKAEGDWVLFVDADERVTASLREEIITNTANQQITKYDGFYIKRQDFMWGRQLKHGETGNIKLLRLARKNYGQWTGRVHEVWKVKGRVGQLKNPIYHFPHQKIKQFLTDINTYSDLRAKELYDKGVKAYWWSVILYPKIKFFVNFFFRRGFLDGIAGLSHALVMSFHSFLVRGKLWLLWQKRN